MKVTSGLVCKAAIGAAFLAMSCAAPVWAQGSNAGISTPSSGGNEVSPRKGPLPGRASTSTIPDKAQPQHDNEVGPQSPPEHSNVIPPAGSARAANPKTPKSANEASNARPETDVTNKGATSGATGAGMQRRGPDPMNR